ncbi:hypothetical protein K438DRAFT_1660184 [Mycena galopus ATCC 62051]|nr:hypothetical protein K438DRAFT_1660184 [Mycena galopus ATCC 62051]
MKPPRTPPHPTGAEKPTKSTPQAKGSSGNSQSAQHSKQEDYAPFLKEDIAHERTITVQEFLLWILGRGGAGKDEFESTLRDPKFEQLVDDYTAKISKETDLYHRFVNLANWCLDQHEINAGDVRFCRNDPVLVLDSDAGRKPDVVIVRLATVNKDGRYGVDEISKGGPQDAAFYWRELLSFWEFKPDDIPEPVEKKASTSKSKKQHSQSDQPPPTLLPTRRSERNVGQNEDPPSTSGSHHSTSESRKRSGDTLTPIVPEKRPKKDEDPKLQCASYALELLSNGGVRSHVVAVLVSRNSLELLYYDRSIVVKSEPLRFTRPENRATFLAVLSGFGRLGSPRWGYPELLTPPAIRQMLLPKPPKGFWRGMYQDHVLELKDGWKLTLEKILFRAHGVIGRGTVVVRATVTSCPRLDLTGKTVVVKWSWVPKTRIPEVDIVNGARQHAMQDRPEMLRHLPDIYHSQQFDRLVSDAQRSLFQNLPAGTYEERVLRVIVQEELRSIDELEDPVELAQALKQIFECYRWLYEETKTIHRDVSVSNLMFHEVDGNVYGVLNDFDLALCLNDETPSTSKQRTGTKPYMAIDLLVPDPPYHLYRHDLESFLYVLVFLTCQIEGSTLAKWEDLAMEELNHRKNTAITKNDFPPTKDHFQRFGIWIIGISTLFRTGFNNRSSHLATVELAKLIGGALPPSFDDVTLDNSVTFDKFAAILEVPIIQS